MLLHWYRSRFFWFGLGGLVLLFIAWLSIPGSTLGAGYTTRGGPGIPTGRHSYNVAKSLDSISFTHVDHDASPMISAPVSLGWEGWRYPLEEDRLRFFGKPYRSHEMPGHQMFELANWVIILCYILLWLGGLVLWQRRKHRLMKPPAMADGQP